MELIHQAEVIRAGDLEVRPADHLALARGRALSLSMRELELLAALARRQGRIVAREELYATVWGAPFRDQERSVDVYVHKLRSKLAGAIPGCRFIHTHFGFGYRFEPEHSADFVGQHRHSADFVGQHRHSADFVGQHRHSADFVGQHRPSHPFHKGQRNRQEDGTR
jgi:DNA-binding winged helix-turn-helix (wHTH) protein